MSDLIQLLDKYRNSKIAIYGLGVESERVLAEIGNVFEIVGLLDGYRTEGSLYGQKIISMDAAVAAQVKLILVVARPGSCKAIAKRIGQICVDNQIALMDIRGNDLCFVAKETYSFAGFGGYTKAGFVEKVSSKAGVSFDLFDTLVMRMTMFSTDVLELLDDKLHNMGIVIEDFASKRLECEKELAKRKAPSLIEIYTYMKQHYNIAELIPEQVAELEWQTDYELIIPRKEVVDLFDHIAKLGEKVYIISDSYYSREQLVKICDKCDITNYTDIYDSCEYGVSKTQGLFNVFLDGINEDSLIHVGDDLVADVESATNAGLESFHLYSGLELFEMTGYMGTWCLVESLCDRVKAGLLIAKLFNSPFQFESTEGALEIDSSYDLAYIAFAPIITDFVIWFRERIQQMGLKTILFGARDGYLIKKLYDYLCLDSESVYFLTSRTAVIRAGIENKNDVKYVADMKFSGSVEEQLMVRFGIKLEEKVGADKDIFCYLTPILEKASRCKANYLKYINALRLGSGELVFFDFVAKGTTQLYLKKLISNPVRGIYFLQLEPEYMKNKDVSIESFYLPNEAQNSAIYEGYYILETVLTAPHASVYEFEEDGSPIYANDSRTLKDLECLGKMQQGISEYFEMYLQICSNHHTEINKRLDEAFFQLVHKIKVIDKDFLAMKVEDPFFNRMTDITDVV